MSCHFGGLNNPAAQTLLKSNGILDISGGDSFTDLYGQRRFSSTTELKLLYIRLKKPLILLPQTFGPFNRLCNRKRAQYICRNAAMAWARDHRSFETLRDLLGNAYDPVRHCCGVDVAFGLPTKTPTDDRLRSIRDWFEMGNDMRPIVGLNVSGLIYNRPDAASHQYHLKADYRAVIHDLIRRLISKHDARVMLLAHVVTPPEQGESDITACQSVLQLLHEFGPEQLRMAPIFDDPREAKWLISQCDWFCGTRMHSTIAGLSTGVPTAAITYSIKTQGVFESCNQGECVADPRVLTTSEMIDQLCHMWQSRAKTKASINAALPTVLRQAERQIHEIIAFLTSNRGGV